MQGDVADDGRAGTNDNSVANGRVALALASAFRAQGYPVVEQNVIADNCGFADHDAHAMVDDQTATDLGSWVNLDAREHASVVCPNAGESLEVKLPEQVCLAVVPECM